MPSASLEVSYYRTRGQCRVTCRRPVADFLVGELRAAMAAATAEKTREACELGLTALLRAIAEWEQPYQRIGPMRMGESEPDRLWNRPRQSVT